MTTATKTKARKEVPQSRLDEAIERRSNLFSLAEEVLERVCEEGRPPDYGELSLLHEAFGPDDEVIDRQRGRVARVLRMKAQAGAKAEYEASKRRLDEAFMLN